MRTFVFACIHNAGRSQMAAALFNRLADPQRAKAVSAGTQPAATVHPVVVEAMREIGIDLSASKPQKLTTELAANAEMLVTMGCGEECPYIPGPRARRLAAARPERSQSNKPIPGKHKTAAPSCALCVLCGEINSPNSDQREDQES